MNRALARIARFVPAASAVRRLAAGSSAALVLSALMLSAPIVEAKTPPLPLARPDPDAPVRTSRPSSKTTNFGFKSASALRLALDAVKQDRYKDAVNLASKLDNLLDQQIVAWFVARAPNSGLTADQILDIHERHLDWPEPERLRFRAEQALLRSAPNSDQVLDFYSDHDPATTAGRIALARALMSNGKNDEAVAEIRDVWRTANLSRASSLAVYVEFKEHFEPEDHWALAHRLVYSGNNERAVRVANIFGEDEANYIKALGVVFAAQPEHVDRESTKVASNFRGEPSLRLIRAKALRRRGDAVAAAILINSVPPEHEKSTDPDRWWIERRALTRALLDRDLPQLAYQISSGYSQGKPKTIADAEFHAGWVALRFLDRPDLAIPHFQRIADIATLPRTISRASYWLGRAFEASGDETAAALHYKNAGRFGGTYHGQLAREAIGLTTTGLETIPTITATDRLNFAARSQVQAIHRLAAAGHGYRAMSFFKNLAETLESPGEIALAATLARRIGEHNAMMVIGEKAGARGIAVGGLQAPLIGIPPKSNPDAMDRALVYAVARQESRFNPAAVSPVGARGLMQLMPATAKETAQIAGLSYAPSRLTNDPAYNVALGSTYLDGLLDRFDGSYILAFAAYNAGPSRSNKWVKAYGDPRGGQVDPIDWIERIPFSETRSYVQRVIENLQSYRTRLSRPLSLRQDLVRGAELGTDRNQQASGQSETAIEAANRAIQSQ